jgi:hypothetical protein
VWYIKTIEQGDGTMYNKRHTYFDVGKGKVIKETPVASKTIDGHTIELWPSETWGDESPSWYIEIDGKEVDDLHFDSLEAARAEFEEW